MAVRPDELAAPLVLEWPAMAELLFREHKQGEHIAVVGPTGSGKTVLVSQLCRIVGSRRGRDRRPSRVVVIATKPRDDTMRLLDWPRIREWPPGYGKEHVVFWPSGAGDPQSAARRQRAAIEPVLRAIYQEGGQTVCLDEVAYFEDPLPDGLGLRPTIRQFWRYGRSNRLTVIAGTQRPREVSRSMWSESSWLFAFRLDDQDDLKRVAEIGGDRAELVAAVNALGGHEFVVVRKQRGGVRSLYVSKVGT